MTIRMAGSESDLSGSRSSESGTDFDGFLERAEKQLTRDYGWIPVWLGVAMIVGGFAHIVLRGEFVFSLTVMVWGSLVFCLGLLLRHRSSRRILDFARLLAARERELALIEKRARMVGGLIEAGVTGEDLERWRELISAGPTLEEVEPVRKRMLK